MRQKVKGSLETVSLVNTIGQEYGIDNIELSISTLWESSTNQYMITGLSSKNDHKNKCKDAKGVINNKFIIDASLGNEKAMVRETKFVFEDDEGYSFNDHLIDCFSLGTFSVFHTFRNNQGLSLEAPIFFVHN